MAPSLSFCVLVVFVVIASATFAAGTGKRYKVGGPGGWHMPAPENQNMYMNWVSNVTFYVEDSIEFVYRNDSVIKVDKVGYYHCNETAAVGGMPKDGSTLFVLDKPGYSYFASGDLEHCKKGQRLMINVETLPSPPALPVPAPAPHPSAAVALVLVPFVRVLVSVTILALLGLI